MSTKKHDVLEQKMCKELEELENKYKQGQEMSIQDLDKIDKLYHALKSMATYHAMKEAEEYEQESEGGFSGDGRADYPGNSGYRGRAMNGRYVSRAEDRYYDDGYARGYSEAMNQSGHVPMSPYYPVPRRW